MLFIPVVDASFLFFYFPREKPFIVGRNTLGALGTNSLVHGDIYAELPNPKFEPAHRTRPTPPPLDSHVHAVECAETLY